MPAEPVRETKGLLQIDRSRCRQADGAGQRFRRDVNKETIVLFIDNGQANTTAGDGIAKFNVFDAELPGIDRQAHGAGAVVTRSDSGDAAAGSNDS
jgi:hypothetical protein